jgi:hypothetical protein
MAKYKQLSTSIMKQCDHKQRLICYQYTETSIKLNLNVSFINLHTTASLIIPTDIRAAFASSMNAWMLASSSEHPGGTTGKESWSP